MLANKLWHELGGGPAGLAALELRRGPPVLASELHVEELLVGAAGATLLAAAELAEARTGRAPAVALDVDRLAIAACSERWVRRGGVPVGAAFDALSSFHRASDGWVRLHGNYPWHRDALLRALGVSAAGDVPDAVRARRATDVEDAVIAAGGAAAVVRTAERWRAGDAGAGTGRVVEWEAGPETPGAATSLDDRRRDALPATGLRVLDFTRVIAGPVGTRMLAALGASVTRIHRPDRPELPVLVIDGRLGKRWVELDLREPPIRERLEAELATSDAVVLGHRPGALDAFGLSPGALAARHPHLVVVSLSAWGTRGPWAQRRGFDSLVQAATGIAHALGDPEAPGALPVQALDHASGYLIAAAVLRGLTERATHRRAPRASLSLAATAHALLAEGTRPKPAEREIDPAPHLVDLGDVRVAKPPGEVDGQELSWPVAR